MLQLQHGVLSEKVMIRDDLHNALQLPPTRELTLAMHHCLSLP